MPRPLPINDPYKPKLEDKLRDMIVLPPEYRKAPFYIPTVKAKESK